MYSKKQKIAEEKKERNKKQKICFMEYEMIFSK